MLKDQLKLHLTVFLWGFTAILGAMITLSSLELVFYRTLISSLALIGIVYIVNKRLNTKLPDTIQALKILGTGMLIALHWIFFFGAAKVSTVSICLAGMATCSLFTSFIEPLIMRTRVKSYEVVIGLLVISGLYTIFKFEVDHFWGIIMALIASLLASLFSVINKRLVKNTHAILVTTYEMIGACLGCLIFLPIYIFYPQLSETGGLTYFPNWEDFGYLLILALVCTVYTYYTSIELLNRMTAFNINLVVNMEPIYGICLAFLFFGEKEKMSPGFYLGTLIILASVMIYPFLSGSKQISLFKKS